MNRFLVPKYLLLHTSKISITAIKQTNSTQLSSKIVDLWKLMHSYVGKGPPNPACAQLKIHQ
jgi:hypothetical protein